MIDHELKKQWGFHPLFESYYLAETEGRNDLLPARIIFAGRDHFEVLFIGQTQSHLAKVRGHYYQYGWEMPAVGDWVLIERVKGQHDFLPIDRTLPRRTCLQRPIGKGFQVLLANTDYIGLVTSFNEDLNERRLERALLMSEESGAKPFIVINKADLISEVEVATILARLQNRFPSVPVIACWALKSDGVQKITQLFEVGETVTFLGMSGVGKSSIANSILNQNRMETSEIRESDGRGRHTTTARHLILSNEGFWIADTPGIREFTVFGEKESLDLNFDQISQLSEKCKFKDCTHQTEPSCAVKAALAAGEVDEELWKSYLKLLREIEFHTRKHNKELRSQQSQMWAKAGRDRRARFREKDFK